MSGTLAKVAVVAAMLLLFVIGSSSCKTRPHLMIHQSDTLSIMLHELPAGYPSLAPFSYTHVIEPNDTFTILESLYYEVGARLPFSRGERHRVFTRHQAELLAPDLAKALNLALPHEVAAFIVADTETATRHTKGLVFVLGDELHLIIEELQKPRYEGEQKTYQPPLSRWSLLPGDGQRLYTSRPGGKGAITNWVIAPLR